MKNKIILIISLVFGMLLAASNSFAGQVESTTVQSIQIHSTKITIQAQGLVLYTFADLPTGSPACATDPLGRMIFPAGRGSLKNSYEPENGPFFGSDARVYEALLDAYNNDSLLDVIGTGDCYLGFEVVQLVILKK